MAYWPASVSPRSLKARDNIMLQIKISIELSGYLQLAQSGILFFLADYDSLLTGLYALFHIHI